MSDTQVAIVGGGIIGLAHALHAARRGLRVVLFERNECAQGASIRNFGMIWPIGQPAGARLQLALRSRDLWQDVLRSAGLESAGSGSIHLAYHDDEADVIAEFVELGPSHGYQCRWMSPDEILARCPGVRRDGLQGGLWSDTELVVDPRQVARVLPRYLAEVHGVELRYGCPVQSVELPVIRTAAGEWSAERVVVCGGDDLSTLFPDVLASSGLLRCKLQMMRTGPQPGGWCLGSALAAGLTLRFYPAFRLCASLADLERRITAQMPEYQRYGIHVMASQTPAGEITIGDSHEYGEAISIFDKSEIERLILKYLHNFLNLPDPTVAERWHGTYVKHPDLPYFTVSPEPGVRVVTGFGGAGMTLSFGAAEKTWSDWR